MNNKNQYYLGIDGSYSHLDLALYCDDRLIHERSLHNTKASSQLVPILQELLDSCTLSLEQLSFIAVNRGPGALTSLRVTLATMNGIGFTRIVPLVGVLGLDALALDALQMATRETPVPEMLIVTLLNAYNNDVYICAYRASAGVLTIAIAPIVCHISDITTVCGPMLMQHTHAQRVCIGNGSVLCRPLFAEQLKDIPLHYFDRETPSGRSIALRGYDYWCASTLQTMPQAPHYRLEPWLIKLHHFSPKFLPHLPE